MPVNGTTDDEERFLADLTDDPNPLPDSSHGRRLYVANWVLQQAPPTGIELAQAFGAARTSAARPRGCNHRPVGAADAAGDLLAADARTGGFLGLHA